jgi:hypothetical protein
MPSAIRYTRRADTIVAKLDDGGGRYQWLVGAEEAVPETASRATDDRALIMAALERNPDGLTREGIELATRVRGKRLATVLRVLRSEGRTEEIPGPPGPGRRPNLIILRPLPGETSSSPPPPKGGPEEKKKAAASSEPPYEDGSDLLRRTPPPYRGGEEVEADRRTSRFEHGDRRSDDACPYREESGTANGSLP